MSDPPASMQTPPEAGMAARAVAFGEALVRYAVEWIDDRRYAIRHRHYIEELDRAGELDGLLEAIGITRAQLQAFEISPLASAELLSRLAARIGLDVADIKAEGDSPELRCRTCENWRECRHWLERGADDSAYRAFCPNAKLIDRLRARSKAVG